MSCCEAQGNSPGGDTAGSIINVGGGRENYVVGSVGPWELRTLTSTDSSLVITQGATTLNLRSGVSLANEGTGVEIYDTATSTATTKNLRRLTAGPNVTISSSGGTITISANIPAVATCSNTGTGADIYTVGTSVPFAFRRLKPVDARTTVTQNATDISIGTVFAVANEGVGAQVFDTATSTITAANLRSLTSTDSTVVITQGATTLNLASGVSLANEGGAAEVFDTTTSTATAKNLRTIKAGTNITVTQNATDITVQANITIANEGGLAEVYDTALSTISSKKLRTIGSTGGTVLVTQNATTLNLEVAASALKTYFSEITASIGTNGTTYVVVATMGAVTGAVQGETWVFVASALVCCVLGQTTVNQKVRWEIETSAGVWGALETDLSFQWGISVTSPDKSTPFARTYQAVLGMNAPRLRVLTCMSAVVAGGGVVENPKVSGYRRS